MSERQSRFSLFTMPYYVMLFRVKLSVDRGALIVTWVFFRVEVNAGIITVINHLHAGRIFLYIVWGFFFMSKVQKVLGAQYYQIIKNIFVNNKIHLVKLVLLLPFLLFGNHEYTEVIF